MAKPTLKSMTLREKIGQTGMPSPGTVKEGVERCGGYGPYFRETGFTGFYFVNYEGYYGDKSPAQFQEEINEANRTLDIPILVSVDGEYGSRSIHKSMHNIPTMMSLGAAQSHELAFKRSYYWAKELRACGINWPFGPVGDMLLNFFSPMGIRCMSDDADVVSEFYPDVIRGIQAAGVAATAKHYPGSGSDYRDSHFCACSTDASLEEWTETYGKIWKSAVDAGALSFMSQHLPFPAVDPSFARGKIPRPATASKKVMDILRKDIGFDGVLVTDAVSMKGLAAAFEHDDVYIECFNAGNDIILFVDEDYIDVMEKAVKDGRVSMERLDESVERILNLKEKLGLFDEVKTIPALTKEEIADFENTNYEIGKRALTLISNEGNMIPFKKDMVKNVTIVAISSYEPFADQLEVMVDAFKEKGITAKVIRGLESKDQLKELSETEDMIIYACFIAQGQTPGMPFFTSRELSTLFNVLSYGAEKSVAASFGAPSIYYNYFEEANAYINAYSPDIGTTRAFVDGLLGEFEFTGKSPVSLRPKFAK